MAEAPAAAEAPPAAEAPAAAPVSPKAPPVSSEPPAVVAADGDGDAVAAAFAALLARLPSDKAQRAVCERAVEAARAAAAAQLEAELATSGLENLLASRARASSAAWFKEQEALEACPEAVRRAAAARAKAARAKQAEAKRQAQPPRIVGDSTAEYNAFVAQMAGSRRPRKAVRRALADAARENADGAFEPLTPPKSKRAPTTDVASWESAVQRYVAAEVAAVRKSKIKERKKPPAPFKF